MAEASNTQLFFDARNYTYLPSWAKALVLGAAMLLLLLAVVMIYRTLAAQQPGGDILFYLSLAQTGALALIFGVILLFSTRDANVHHLRRLGDQFLGTYMAEALARVSIPEMGINGFSVSDQGRKDIFGRVLEMHSPKLTFRVWVGHNVRRLFVIYFVPLSECVTAERLQQVFTHTFGGSEQSGFKVNFESASIGDNKFVSIWLTTDTSSDLLYNPREKLYWAQDVAMMTESFLRTAHRNAIGVEGTIEPGPL